jgi:hypothetical protein
MAIFFAPRGETWGAANHFRSSNAPCTGMMPRSYEDPFNITRPGGSPAERRDGIRLPDAGNNNLHRAGHLARRDDLNLPAGGNRDIHYAKPCAKPRP